MRTDLRIILKWTLQETVEIGSELRQFEMGVHISVNTVTAAGDSWRMTQNRTMTLTHLQLTLVAAAAWCQNSKQ